MIKESEMSLPTAHNYIFQNLKLSLDGIEKNFLEPNLLLKQLVETEKALNEGVDAMRRKEFSKEIIENEKEVIISLIDKMKNLEKASQEKLNWVGQFSNFLQTYNDIK
jgi:hypothetical protein